MRGPLAMTALLATLVFAPITAQAQVSFDIGIRIGTPPPAPRVVRVVPRSPGPDFIWVSGYWYPQGNHYRWHDGYWTRPPYMGARWIGPRYESGRFFDGYWESDRGRIVHDHQWDKDRDRDRDRGYREDRPDPNLGRRER